MPSGAGGATTRSATVDLSAAKVNRSSYLRQVKSHSPPRGRRFGLDKAAAGAGGGDDSSIYTHMSRRQRLRAEAVNQSMDSYAIGKRRDRRALLSRREQIHRDTERAYYAHEQQLRDVQAGIPTSGPVPPVAAAVAGGSGIAAAGLLCHESGRFSARNVRPQQFRGSRDAAFILPNGIDDCAGFDYELRWLRNCRLRQSFVIVHQDDSKVV